MEIQSVLVECRHRSGNSYFGSSGSMFDSSYVITTLNSVSNFLTNSDLEKLVSENSESLLNDTSDFFRDILIIIYVKTEESNIIKYEAHVEACFQSNNIKETAKLVFRNWSFDSIGSHCTLMSLFVVLKIDGVEGRLIDDIESWFTKIPQMVLSKGESLSCVSSAFGNKDFMDHFSQGVVSNILGRNNCLIFSDMPLTPGSEGSPVFCEVSNQLAIGIVISTINWWKGEWLNFTVIADLRQLFSEVLQRCPFGLTHRNIITADTRILSTMESSLIQVYNGTVWGTAIVINKEKGILITNAHVIEPPAEIQISYGYGRDVPCDVVFSNRSSSSLDIAVLRAKKPLDEKNRTILFSEKKIECGDLVFAVGFPIFGRETNPGATITKGHVCHVHPHMIKTTCSIHPGASGGAILDQNGKLVAVIVSNARTSDPINMTYPRMNMCIPAKLLEPILTEYVNSGDIGVLRELTRINAKMWNFSSKL